MLIRLDSSGKSNETSAIVKGNWRDLGDELSTQVDIEISCFSSLNSELALSIDLLDVVNSLEGVFGSIQSEMEWWERLDIGAVLLHGEAVNQWTHDVLWSVDQRAGGVKN